jgi:hypothetical protein
LYSQHRDDSIQRDIRITRFTVHTLGRLNQQSVRRTSTAFWLQTENGWPLMAYEASNLLKMMVLAMDIPNQRGCPWTFEQTSSSKRGAIWCHHQFEAKDKHTQSSSN